MRIILAALILCSCASPVSEEDTINMDNPEELVLEYDSPEEAIQNLESKLKLLKGGRDGLQLTMNNKDEAFSDNSVKISDSATTKAMKRGLESINGKIERVEYLLDSLKKSL